MKRIYGMFAFILVFAILTACGTSGNGTSTAEVGNQSTAAAQVESNGMAAEDAAQAGVSAEGEAIQYDAQPAQTTGNLIGEDEAKRIALEDAGITEADISGIFIHLDMDDGVQEYEVEFYSGTEEYDYEIHAIDGTIRGKDREIENIFPPDAPQTGSEAAFSEQDAIALVLGKVSGATEDLIRMHLDRDDGILIYEGSLVYDGVEYDFEINAETGELREWEAEREHHD